VLFEVTYQTKKDAADPHSDFRRSFYVESEIDPSPESLVEWVRNVAGDDFAPETIEISEQEEGCDPEKLREFRKHIPVYRF